MACWRVLELLGAPNNIPQLLVKADFRPKSYTVFFTDLSNIWSEELDLDDIVRRASEQESPIEVSRLDTAQLTILLENVQKSLESGDDSTVRITGTNSDGIVLHTTITLPKPLGSLAWVFNLEKRAAVTLKNELILPLLVSSHIQHERVAGLVSTIHEKDRAITRLIDQYESSGLDLTTAFPSIAGAKPGKRIVKREQAARHVPALQPFEEGLWKVETSKLKNDGASTLEMFQEALSQCIPHVPGPIKSDDVDEGWWSLIPKALIKSASVQKPKRKQVESIAETMPAPDDDETETEDEFETHANFKLREESKALNKTHQPIPPVAEKHQPVEEHRSMTEDEDEDLDAPPRSQSQHPRSKGKTPAQHTLKHRASPSPSPPSNSPPKRKGFRIGGAKAKEAEAPPPPPTNEADDAEEDMPDAPLPTRTKVDTGSTTSRPKKTFKIGGRGKTSSEKEDDMPPPETSSIRRKGEEGKESSIHANNQQVPSNRQLSVVKAETPEEEHEETPEEKAERRRMELKRKNEELAKKQTQKKKKRF